MRPCFRRKLGLLGALLLSVCGCGWLPGVELAPSRPTLEVPPERFPPLADDSDLTSLVQCIRRSIDQLDRLPAERSYQTAGERVTVADLRQTLTAFQDAVLAAPKPIDWASLIGSRFRLLRAEPPSGFLFTGYYEPELPARRERSERFRYPIYRVPDDLVQIDLSAYCPGCTEPPLIGRVRDRGLAPYYSRAEIDGEGVLLGQDLELAWLDDPIEVFFLHVQGSGLLRFEDGTAMQVGFAASNGRNYRSIGKMLVDSGKVPLESASLQTLKQYLREHPDERDAVLQANERYVFFRPVPIGPIGSFGVPLTPGRSIAVDPASYPLGSLAFIQTQRPGDTRAVPLSRFVCAQDAGAAITGPGRVDVFWGAGTDAERIAGPMRAHGEMYLLVGK